MKAKNAPPSIQKHVLPNGLTVLTETMPQVRSVSLGIWLATGSRHEMPEHTGICHFIEHMLFKGTTNRSVEEIARSMDSIGGHMDAFTAKECVSFNAVVLDEHLPTAFDILSDLVLHPRFDPSDIARERKVVIEEIKAEEDNPDYLLHELFIQKFWKNHPLGKPILGTRQTIRSLERVAIREQFERFYRPENMIIAAAGQLQPHQLLKLVANRFDRLPKGKPRWRNPAPVVQPHVTLRDKQSLEQVHICLGVPSYPIAHKLRYACYVLNTILGGGMSSRLFQNIRERQGLAYAVFSELAPYRDTGCLIVYAATSRESVARVVSSILQEFRELREKGVTPEEMRRAKDHLKGSMMLGLESTAHRMSNLTRQELYFGRFFTLDEILERIEAVTAKELAKIAEEFFRTEQISLTVLGRLDGIRMGRKQLIC